MPAFEPREIIIPDKYFSISVRTIINGIMVLVFLFLISSPTITMIKLTPFSWIVALLGVILFFIYLTALKVDKNIFIYSLLMIIILLYTSITAYLAGEINTRIVTVIISSFGYIALILFVIYPIIIRKYNSSQIIIYKIFAYAVTIHSVITIIFFIYPELRIAIQPIFHLSEFGHETLTEGWRAVGLNAQSGETISVSHGMALYMISRLVIKKDMSIRFGILLILIILSSLALMNRTGLVIAFLGLLLGFSLPLYQKGVKFKYLFAILSVMIIIFISLIQISKTHSIRALDRTLEAYYHYQQYKELSTSSTERLFSSYLFIPDVPLLFGEGIYGIGQNLSMDRPSDMGYIRLYNGGGIIAVLLWLLIPIVFIVISNKKHESRSLAIFLAFTWLLVNIKVLWFMPAGGPAVVVAILLLLARSENEKIYTIKRTV